MTKNVHLKTPELPVIVSCEHASNHVPIEFKNVVADYLKDSRDKTLMQSHRAWDPGAINLANQLAKHFKKKAHRGEITRLLIDLNRSKTHSNLHFSGFKSLLPDQKRLLLWKFYQPYHAALATNVEHCISLFGFGVHFSVHSFTPQMNGKVRRCDFGILFDPSRKMEREVATQIRQTLIGNLKKKLSNQKYKVWFNHPYRGVSDGTTTTLRRQFSASRYIGIEIEINQRLLRNGRLPAALTKCIIASIGLAVKNLKISYVENRRKNG